MRLTLYLCDSCPYGTLIGEVGEETAYFRCSAKGNNTVRGREIEGLKCHYYPYKEDVNNEI